MTIIEHLEELRSRIIRMLIAFCVAAVAACSAQLSGWCSGRSVTAVPMRIRRVRAAMTGTTMSGFDSSEKAPPKCSSAR